jgi:membrane protein YqaA with SNARE-associated domain
MGAIIAVVAGAIVGGAVMYSVAVNDPRATNVFLARIPLISAGMVSATGARIRAGGLISLIDAPLRGIPYKIYAAQAGEQGLAFPAFLLITVLARLERLLPVVLIAGVVGKAFRDLVEKHTPLMLGVYAIGWCVIYFLYYLSVR